MNNYNCHSETPRDGSGQLGRYLQALDPAYAPIDGRSIEELLVFAQRYAAQIRFHDIPESAIADDAESKDKPGQVSWREFFRRDMAVIAASISVVDTAQIKRDYDQFREQLEAHPSRDAFKGLFDPILGLAAQIDRWHAIAIPPNPLRADLDLAIDSTLRGQVKKVVAYAEAYQYIDRKHPLELDLSALTNSSLWGLDATIDPDPSIYQGASLEDQIRHAALFVDDIFHAFYGFMTGLVEVKSVGYMRFALEAYPAHQPHMALFIAFLQLFRLTQDQMNGLTGRMLDYYYQDVLHLTPKPSIPDRVHVVFDLAKDVAQYGLAQGTALKAGKDAAGKEQIYTTETDLVVNQAKVKELKTVFIQKTPGVDPAKGTVDAIYARPVAASLDGFGEKITDPSGKWPTFGKGEVSTPSEPKNICEKSDPYQDTTPRKDQAQIGFAIASPQLLLQGGNRLIVWHIVGLSDLLPAPKKGEEPSYDLEIWLTGANGWLKIGRVLDDTEFNKLRQVEISGIFNPELAKESGYYIDRKTDSFYIYLPVSECAIVRFDPNLHGGYSYDTRHPLARVMLGPRIGIVSGDFQGLTLEYQSLAVWVGSINPMNGESETLHFDGLKTLVLQNDTGLLAANKPFDPSTRFYIGSGEIFNKPLSKLAVDIKKNLDPEINIPTTTDRTTTVEDVPEYSVSLLIKKEWNLLVDKQGKKQLTRLDLSRNILNYVTQKDGTYIRVESLPFDRKPIESVTELETDTLKGFIKLENLQRGASIVAVQDLAAELQIKEISVSYYSELKQLDPMIEQFFHVYPFGVTEVFIEELYEGPGVPATGYITSWLVLGPIYNILHQKTKDNNNNDIDHFDTDWQAPNYHPKKGTIITDIGNNPLNPKKLTGLLQDAPKKGGTQLYGYDVGAAIFPKQSYTWRAMEFSPPDDNNYLTYHDNIHELDARSFAGWHHSLAFFLVYIISPDARTTDLCVRSDDSLRVWLNGCEIDSLSFLDDRDINDKTVETRGTISLRKGYNILLAAVAETHKEWGFTARLTNYESLLINTDGSNISPVRPLQIQKLFDTLDKTKGNLLVDAHRKLLPQFTYLSPNAADQSEASNNQYSGDVQEEGMLFIGLEKLQPLDTLSLLFQFAEGSATDEDNDPPKIHWSYLTYNEWRPLQGEDLISDGTYGFQTTGIVKLEVPEDSTDHNTIMPDRLRWFCASVTEYSDRIPMLVNVVAQAVEAGFQDNGNDPSHFDKALPAGSIGKLAVAVAEVGKVSQPFSSFDGKHKEVGKEFYTRVSERLRHKARAIMPWDYEHLVLDRFPGIYKVKCITHTDPNCLCRKDEKTCCGPQVAPGHVLIVPIPNLKNRNAANPLQPKTSRGALLEIQEYLGKRASPFVCVRARNPVYEQILVSFKVQFTAGADKGYRLKTLNEEIVQYLTPWVFDENADVSFAQKVYASAVINFIEERPYVDFITDFIMFVCHDECCPVNKPVGGAPKPIADVLAQSKGCPDLENWFASGANGSIGEVIACPSTQRSLLVSAPQHIIVPL